MTIHRGSLPKRGNPESVDEGNQFPNTLLVTLTTLTMPPRLLRFVHVPID